LWISVHCSPWQAGGEEMGREAVMELTARGFMFPILLNFGSRHPCGSLTREWQNPNCYYKSSKPLKLKNCWTPLCLISNNFSLSSCLQPHSFAHVWKTFHWNHI
jgi:hypothetical protein